MSVLMNAHPLIGPALAELFTEVMFAPGALARPSARWSRRWPPRPRIATTERSPTQSFCVPRAGRRTYRSDQGAAMARAGAPWVARAGAVRDRRKAERHGAARDGGGLGSVALVGLRRDGMPGGRAYSRDFQLPDETRRRIRSGATYGAYIPLLSILRCSCTARAGEAPLDNRHDTGCPNIIPCSPSIIPSFMSGPSSKRSGEAFSGRSWNATANASLIVHTKCQSALRSNACQQQLEPGDRPKSPKTDRPGGHRSGRTP